MIEVNVQVYKVNGNCPVFKKGDTILFVKDESSGSFYIDLERTKLSKICASTMGSLLTELIKVHITPVPKSFLEFSVIKEFQRDVPNSNSIFGKKVKDVKEKNVSTFNQDLTLSLVVK